MNASAFPTPASHPHYNWQRLASQPTTIFAKVPTRDPARTWLYVFSERTRETYQRLCSDPARMNAAIVDFARQYG